jgi:hypothetical protein
MGCGATIWARHASTGARGGVVVRGRSCGGRGAVVVERMECGDCEHDGPAERPGPGLIGCIIGRTLDNGRAQSSKGVFAATNASPDLPSWPAAGPAAALALLSLAAHSCRQPTREGAVSRSPAATTPTSTGSFESSPPGEASPGWWEECFAHPASCRLPGHISPPMHRTIAWTRGPIRPELPRKLHVNGGFLPGGDAGPGQERPLRRVTVIRIDRRHRGLPTV